MPVLLLARGDSESRELLKKSIIARYGTRPPVIESLQMGFNGRIHTKVGPIKAWVPLELSASFLFPDAMRWDFVAKPIGVAVMRGVDSYDGAVMRTLRGNGKPTVIEDSALIVSLQKRLWAVAALLLTPLGDHFVELKQLSDLSFSATNTQINASVTLNLRENHQIDEVSVLCLNPDTHQEQRFKLRISDELVTHGELLLPKQITAYWDDVAWFEVEPTAAQDNPDFAKDVFTLGADALTQ